MNGPEMPAPLALFLEALGVLLILIIVGAIVFNAVELTRPWREKRALIRLAHTWGIEYVPGESLEALRRKVLAKRDAGTP